MSEKKLQLIEASKVIFVLAFALLYAWGGMEEKWLRRFLAPCVLCLGMFLYTRDWRTLLQAPIMFGTLCLGYGAYSVAGKVFLRIVFGVTNGVTSSAYISYRALKRPLLWWLVGCHITVLTICYAVLGVVNPLPSARAEEFALGWLIAFLPMMFASRVHHYDVRSENN